MDHAASVSKNLIAQRAEAAEKAIDELSKSVALEEFAREVYSRVPAAKLLSSAERLMTVRGLSVLSLLDERGVTLSSGHLPARLGDPDPTLFEITRAPPKTALPMAVELRGEAGLRRNPALVTARSLDYGELRIWVVGGLLLDQSFAEQLSRMSGTRVEILSTEGPLTAAGTAEPPTLERLFDLGPVARIKVVLSRAPALEAERALERALALLAGLGLGLAILLGAIVSRWITRPVEALTDAARRIASGEFELAVREKASGEVGELVSAFNRMSLELRKTTQQLVGAERVAAWQEVARRLAHEIKNPLTPIRMSLETLLAASRSQDPRFEALFKESASAVLEEVERLGRIVDEFSQFARLPKPQLSRVDLAELVRQVLTFQAAPSQGIEIQRELQPGVLVRADRDQLVQVLLNLLKNAEQALTGGGRIRVGVEGKAGKALLRVDDSGPGIPAENRPRIFEPYFTTKEGGSGLGLAIARRICQEHGGELGLMSEHQPGWGTTFVLELPREFEQPPTESASNREELSP
jgi:signal transduction histidine kinase